MALAPKNSESDVTFLRLCSREKSLEKAYLKLTPLMEVELINDLQVRNNDPADITAKKKGLNTKFFLKFLDESAESALVWSLLDLFCKNADSILSTKSRYLISELWNDTTEVLKYLLHNSDRNSSLIVKLILFFNKNISGKYQEFYKAFIIKIMEKTPQNLDAGTVFLQGITKLMTENYLDHNYKIHVMEHLASPHSLDHDFQQMDGATVLLSQIEKLFMENYFCANFTIATTIRIFNLFCIYSFNRTIQLLNQAQFCDTCHFSLFASVSMRFFNLKRGQSVHTLPKCTQQTACELLSMRRSIPDINEQDKETAQLFINWWSQFNPNEDDIFTPPPPVFPPGCMDTDKGCQCSLENLDFLESDKRECLAIQAALNENECLDSINDDGGIEAIIENINNSSAEMTISSLVPYFVSGPNSDLVPDENSVINVDSLVDDSVDEPENVNKQPPKQRKRRSERKSAAPKSKQIRKVQPVRQASKNLSFCEQSDEDDDDDDDDILRNGCDESRIRDLSPSLTMCRKSAKKTTRKR